MLFSSIWSMMRLYRKSKNLSFNFLQNHNVIFISTYYVTNDLFPEIAIISTPVLSIWWSVSSSIRWLVSALRTPSGSSWSIRTNDIVVCWHSNLITSRSVTFTWKHTSSEAFTSRSVSTAWYLSIITENATWLNRNCPECNYHKSCLNY